MIGKAVEQAVALPGNVHQRIGLDHQTLGHGNGVDPAKDMGGPFQIPLVDQGVAGQVGHEECPAPKRFGMRMAGNGSRGDAGFGQGLEHLVFVGDLVLTQVQLAALVDAQYVTVFFAFDQIVGIVFPGCQKGYRKRLLDPAGGRKECLYLLQFAWACHDATAFLVRFQVSAVQCQPGDGSIAFSRL